MGQNVSQSEEVPVVDDDALAMRREMRNLCYQGTQRERYILLDAIFDHWILEERALTMSETQRVLKSLTRLLSTEERTRLVLETRQVVAQQNDREYIYMGDGVDVPRALIDALIASDFAVWKRFFPARHAIVYPAGDQGVRALILQDDGFYQVVNNVVDGKK